MLSYKLYGKGKPLLLIHGLGVTFSIWRKLLPLLPNTQIVAIELPGIGKSPMPSLDEPYTEYAARQIERLRQHLCISAWAVMTYSSGTRIGETYVNKYSRHVTKIIFLCPAYSPGLRATLLRSALFFDRFFPAWGTWVLSGDRLRLLIRILGFNGHGGQEINLWYKKISENDVNVLKLTLREISDSTSKIFSTPKKPTLCIWGTKDIVVKSYPMVDAINIHTSATHSAPVTIPQDVASFIRNFL